MMMVQEEVFGDVQAEKVACPCVDSTVERLKVPVSQPKTLVSDGPGHQEFLVITSLLDVFLVLYT